MQSFIYLNIYHPSQKHRRTSFHQNYGKSFTYFQMKFFIFWSIKNSFTLHTKMILPFHFWYDRKNSSYFRKSIKLSKCCLLYDLTPRNVIQLICLSVDTKIRMNLDLTKKISCILSRRLTNKKVSKSRYIGCHSLHVGSERGAALWYDSSSSVHTLNITGMKSEW